jgi:uncharacterized lipoprotein YmbA
MRHIRSFAAAACVVAFSLALAACASAPPTLVALPSAGTPADAPLRDGGPSLHVRHVHLPDHLDSLPVVIGHDHQVLVVAERTEWAERPSQGVTRVLRDALAQRLGSSQVLIAGDGRRADAELAVEVMALDPRSDGLHLDARWSIACRTGGRSTAGREAVVAAMPADTPQGVAVATSAALSQLAGALVAQLRCQASA